MKRRSIRAGIDVIIFTATKFTITWGCFPVRGTSLFALGKRMMLCRNSHLTLLAAIGLLLPSGKAIALEPGARLAIVGDSITEQRLYSKYVETYLVACSSLPNVRVFQFGWAGETAGGFVARLTNDLAFFKPTCVTLCYGMNDGQYQLFNETIGNTFRTNLEKIIVGLRGVGVKDVLIGSPGAVDSKYFTWGNYGSLSAAEGYNRNLARLSQIAQDVATNSGAQFAGLHDLMVDVMGRAKSTLGEDYPVCGYDGIHPGPNGHLLMAYAFLRALGCDGGIGEITLDMNGASSVSGSHKIVGQTGGNLTVESWRYPFCFNAETNPWPDLRSVLPFVPFNHDLNRFVLIVKNLKAAGAKVVWGGQTNHYSAASLQDGINLAADFKVTPFDGQFAELIQAVNDKQAFETVMIKNMITNLRFLRSTEDQEPGLRRELEAVVKTLAAYHDKLEAVMRSKLVPVTHTISIIPDN